jgi:hypothetical protein
MRWLCVLGEFYSFVVFAVCFNLEKPIFIIIFCAIVLYLVVYHICFQDGKLCLLVANDKLDGK